MQPQGVTTQDSTRDGTSLYALTQHLMLVAIIAQKSLPDMATAIAKLPQDIDIIELVNNINSIYNFFINQ